MELSYAKYHALLNDFLVIDGRKRRFTEERLSELAVQICNRSAGVGADGVLYIRNSRKADIVADVYNADGSWAEKSGNGLRIASAWLFQNDESGKKCQIEMNEDVYECRIIKGARKELFIAGDLGPPEFNTKLIPVKSKSKVMIQAELEIGGLKFPVTCLSIGNPHAVLFVDNFDFAWQELGADIEIHSAFPNRTNVEFVKVLKRTKIRVAEWERGAGATGSSGTGAAAAVVAGVMSGVVNRECEVCFSSGTLHVHWSADTNNIELTGPVTHIANGQYTFA